MQQKIDQDIKEAMLSKDAAKVSTLRFLKSALKYSAIEKKVESLNEIEIQQIIQKQIKQRKESIEQFSKAGRQDLAEKEIHETGVLESYLPRQLTDVELERLIRQDVALAGVSSKKDFGRMMKILNEKLSSQADAKRISEFLGKILVP